MCCVVLLCVVCFLLCVVGLWVWLSGSCMFKRLYPATPGTTLLTSVITFAAVGLLPATLSGNAFISQLLGFCLFEACVGFYWPLIAEIRSAVIPEESRATIMNFFRVPLNLIVVVVLYKIGDLTDVFVFRFCVTLLGLSAVLSTKLSISAKSKGSNPDEALQMESEALA